MSPMDLLRCMPNAGTRTVDFAKPLTETMLEFLINTPRRQAAFLAQVCHESGSLRYTKELASGSAYDVGELAKRLGNTPEDDGDGERYKGRGLIQITGTDNYKQCGHALGADFLEAPELLETTVYACRSAGWYWTSRQLNQFADTDRFGALTHAINGGYTGLDDRIGHWLRIRGVFSL